MPVDHHYYVMGNSLCTQLDAEFVFCFPVWRKHNKTSWISQQPAPGKQPIKFGAWQADDSLKDTCSHWSKACVCAVSSHMWIFTCNLNQWTLNTVTALLSGASAILPPSRAGSCTLLDVPWRDQQSVLAEATKTSELDTQTRRSCGMDLMTDGSVPGRGHVSVQGSDTSSRQPSLENLPPPRRATVFLLSGLPLYC